MRKLSFWVVAVFFLLAFVGASAAQDFKQVHPGVEYAQVEHKIGSDPVKINLLRLDLKKVRLDVHHAMDAAIGTEKTSSIAKRHDGVAAINSGFFRLDTSIFAGDASDLLVIDGDLISESVNQRTALTIVNGKESTSVEIGRWRTEVTLNTGRGADLKVDGINRERKTDEVIIYTPHFGRSTLTDQSGKEFLYYQYNGDSVGRLLKARDGSSIIGPGEFVASASGKRIDEVMGVATKNGVLGDWFIRTKLISLEGKFWTSPTKEMDMVAGVPQLIKGGKIDITWEQEKASKAFAETRHPRTAVAKLKDGKFLMVTVDGRQPGVSVGMSLQELAEYLLSLGAVDAMNLDGGGSTTMYLDGKVVNTPSDKTGERKIGDAIVVTLRK